MAGRGNFYIAAIATFGFAAALIHAVRHSRKDTPDEMAEGHGDIPARGLFPPSRADDLPRSPPYGSGAIVELIEHDGFVTVFPVFDSFHDVEVTHA